MTCHRGDHCPDTVRVMPLAARLSRARRTRSAPLGRRTRQPVPRGRGPRHHATVGQQPDSHPRAAAGRHGARSLPHGVAPHTRWPARRRLGQHRAGCCRPRCTPASRRLRARQAGLLRIAASYTIAEYLLPPWLDRFLADRPDDSVTLEVTNSRAVLERLESGSVDLGFIESPTAPSTIHPTGGRHRRVGRGGVAASSVGRTRLGRPGDLRRHAAGRARARVGHPRCAAGRAGPARVRSAAVGARPRVVVGGADRGDQRIGPDGHQSARRRRRPGRRLVGRGRRRGTPGRTTPACGVDGTVRAGPSGGRVARSPPTAVRATAGAAD